MTPDTALLPVAALGVLYDLTPAETRVLDLLSAGGTPTTIASELGIARNTVRTHLRRLFDKTGTTRQADLVRLARSMSLAL